MRLVSALVAAILLLMSGLGGITQASTDQLHIFVNSRPVNTDVPPFIEAGRTQVPTRAIFEALGCGVSWAAEHQRVTATCAEADIQLTIGSSTAVVNGREITLETVPRIVQNRTMMPLRFVAEASGAQVDWNGFTRIISITTRPTTPALEFGWGQVGGGLRRTGYNPAAIIGSSVKPLWHSEIEPTSIGFVLGNGYLFATGQSALFALDPVSGDIAWSTPLMGIEMSAGLAFDNERNQVIVSTNQTPEGKLVAVDATTGDVRWSANTPGQWATGRSAPAIVGDLVITTVNGTGTTLYGFDAATGRSVWQVPVFGGGTPAVAGARLFVGYTDGQAFAFRAKDGAPLWGHLNWHIGDAAYAVTVGRGKLFLNDRFRLTVRDEVSGEEIWGLDYALEPGLTESPILVDEVLWVPFQGRILARDADIGTPFANIPLCSGPVSSLAASDTHVFASCGGGLYAVDRTTYSVLRLTDGTGPFALDAIYLYYRDGNGHLAALKAH